MEEFSAFIDGELAERDTNQLIDATKADADVRGTFARYHLIGDVMRTSLPERIAPHFAETITRTIALEPALLVKQDRSPSIAKSIAGLAIVASVAIVVVLSVRHFYGDGDQPEPEIASVPSSGSPVVAVTTEGWIKGNDLPTSTSRLNNYLVSHNQYISYMTVHGVAPYARLVQTTTKGGR